MGLTHVMRRRSATTRTRGCGVLPAQAMRGERKRGMSEIAFVRIDTRFAIPAQTCTALEKGRPLRSTGLLSPLRDPGRGPGRKVWFLCLFPLCLASAMALYGMLAHSLSGRKRNDNLMEPNPAVIGTEEGETSGEGNRARRRLLPRRPLMPSECRRLF